MGSLYVCEFSNGTIKVGRSIDPVTRIANHADRVSCVGIDLVQSRVFGCFGSDAYSESELIRKCAATAEGIRGNEWFEGLEFDAVCLWAERCAELPIPASVHPDSKVIDNLGGPTKVAEKLGYDKTAGGVQRVQNWRNRGIPAEVKIQFPELFMTDLIDRIKSSDDVQNNPGGSSGGDGISKMAVA